MSKQRLARFAVGSPDEPFSTVWRITFKGSTVFLGAGDDDMTRAKLTMRPDGVWKLDATQGPGQFLLKREGSKPYRTKWHRSPPTDHGITVGPIVVVPYTPLGPRPLPQSERETDVHWYPAPEIGEAVEFSVFLVAPGASPDWSADRTAVYERRLANRETVRVFARMFEIPDNYQESVDAWLKETLAKTSEPDAIDDASLYWFSTSDDERKAPVLTDLPLPIMQRDDSPPIIH